MNDPTPLQEELLRWIDGRITPGERQQLESRLRTDPAARAALRELAEQSVLIADVERTAQARDRDTAEIVTPRPWWTGRWAWAAAAAVAFLLGLVFLRPPARPVATVVKVTGAHGFFGAGGSAEQALQTGARLRAGDMIETRSCDSWVELELRDGTHLTLAGNSAVRVLEPERSTLRWNLLRGSLWGSPSPRADAAPLTIQTPNALLNASRSQFDLQANPTETVLRVNDGTARITRTHPADSVRVDAGQQVTASLIDAPPLTAIAQPRPVHDWTCDLRAAPEIILGRRLPSDASGIERLGSVPLLWPVPGRDPVTLYVVGISARRSSEFPVVLQPGTIIQFQGQTTRPLPVRFGFSTQKMQGVFAGKFEVDTPAAQLAPPGTPWTVRIPISDFRPLQPQFSSNPEGLELNDIYALTLREDAGLELHRLAVIPPP